jgi:plastocyanin
MVLLKALKVKHSCRMMRLSALFCMALAVLGTTSFGAETGSIEGIVRFHGQAPKSSVADDAGIHRDLLEVHPKTKGLRYVLIHVVEPSGGLKAREAQETGGPVPPGERVVDQLDQMFTPRVIAVQAGEAVAFTNSDPANHNVRTSSGNATNEFNVFTGSGGKYVHRFAADGRTGPVRLGCDIHPWMRGWIYVFDYPFFAVTDAEGRFRIKGLKPGEYKIRAAQPDIHFSTFRTVQVHQDETVKLDLEIRAEDLPKADAK